MATFERLTQPAALELADIFRHAGAADIYFGLVVIERESPGVFRFTFTSDLPTSDAVAALERVITDLKAGRQVAI